MNPSRPGVMQVLHRLGTGGTERLTIEIVTRLLDRFRFVVCCLDDAGEWAGELTARGVPVVPLNRAPGFHPGLAVRVARVAAAHDVGVLHCHHYSPFVYGRLASLLHPSRRVVFTEHGRLSDAPPTRKRQMANLVLSRLAASAFAVSADLRTHMIAEGFAPARVGVIHNGVDPGRAPCPAQRGEARRRLGVPDDAFLIGAVARLDAVKDLHTAIRAAARLRADVPSARLVIVGSGPEQQALAETIRGSGAGDAVTLAGYRPDVRELMAGFDVYVNSSVSEGISLTILEAMAAGVPVVATRVGGTPEIVVDGSTGVLVPARSVDALAAALLDLARDRDRARLGAAGRARVAQHFTIDRMVDDYAREYARAGRA